MAAHAKNCPISVFVIINCKLLKILNQAEHQLPRAHLILRIITLPSSSNQQF